MKNSNKNYRKKKSNKKSNSKKILSLRKKIKKHYKNSPFFKYA